MKVKKKVRRFLSDTPLPEKKTYLEWVKVPEKEVWPTADVHVWNSKCGIYKVYRIQSRYRDDAPSYASTVKREVAGVPSFHMIESDVLGPGYPKKYKSLDLALASVETHIAKSTKSLVDSNKQTILSYADRMQEEGEFDKKKKEGLSSKTPRPSMNLQSPVESKSKRKGKTMEIVREEAVLLLKELGYKVPDGASNKKLTSMLAKVEEGSPIEDNDKLQELYDAVLEAIQEESPPIVVDEEEEEEKEEKPKKKATKEEKEEKPEKKGIKREGVVAKIVEILQEATSKSPVTKKDILAKLAKAFPDREEEGMKATINTQVPSGLKIRKGLTVEKNDNGYWLPSEKKAKK